MIAGGPTVGGDALDVVVVGGGIIGAATAYHLADLGVDVALVERNTLGREASGRNAGTLNLINDRTRRFADLQLTIRTMERWRRLSDELGYDLEVDLDKGTLLVAEHPSEYDRLAELKAGHEGQGIPIVAIGGSELRRFAPYLAPGIEAAIYCPTGGQANPRLAAWAFGRAAERRGATIRERSEVRAIARAAGGYRVDTTDGPLLARNVVIAAGPWSVAMVAPFDVGIPLRIRYFQVSATSPAPPFIRHGVRRVAGHLTLKQTPHGTCLLGGGWPGIEAFPTHGRISTESLVQNCAVAARVVPAYADLSILRVWAGYDGSTTDERPILDAIPGWPGLFLSTGSNSGFTHGPVLGELTAELTTGRRLSHDITAFSLARFHAVKASAHD
jgi:glycine/D-amino acid oxidase-like deaminating enzyme